MGLNINMSNVKVSGNASLLNGMNVKGESKVNINARNSEIIENAKVLNDINSENGNVKINLEGVKIGKDAEFMNGREIDEYKGNGNKETQGQKNQSRGQNEQTEEVHMYNEKVKKESLLQKLKRLLTRNKTKSENIVIIREDSHKNFENEISRNGTLKGCTDHVILEKSYEENSIQKENDEISK